VTPFDSGAGGPQNASPFVFLQESSMGRNDSRRTPKMRRRRAQRKLKARIRRRIEAGKKASSGSTSAKKSK
jgi:hypothetical protein